MAFIPIPNTVQVETVFEVHGERCENVYHCQFQAAYDATDIANLLDVFRDWWTVNFRGDNTPEVSLVNLIGTDMDSQTGPRVEDATGLPLAGTGTGQAMPGNVTLAVRWLTDQRGRSFRGRTYYIQLREATIDGNVITAGTATDIADGFAQLLTDVSTFGAPLVVASRFSGGAPRTTGLATLITSVFVDRNVDSQRRRLAQRGT